LLNLLSVGAAYGLLVLVFQHGFAADLLGLQRVDAVEAWVPLFLFSVLFGLSMDYQVFLLSRIHERYGQAGDLRGAVVFGVGSTARIITGAALIIVVVFCGFAAGELVMFQQMGFGVAVSLLLDATIVRSVLMPATLAILGDRAWYLPRWLGWLPRLTIEPPATSGPGAPAPASEPGREGAACRLASRPGRPTGSSLRRCSARGRHVNSIWSEAIVSRVSSRHGAVATQKEEQNGRTTDRRAGWRRGAAAAPGLPRTGPAARPGRLPHRAAGLERDGRPEAGGHRPLC
jgi:hypothetical protein